MTDSTARESIADGQPVEIEVGQSCEALRPCRGSLPAVLALLSDRSAAAPGTWNVVDALEVLIDAGQFSTARELASRVTTLVADDERARLFRMYGELCDLLVSGTVADTLATLEQLHTDILEGGHSTADVVRAGSVYARALLWGVSLGCLDESNLGRATAILSIEFERALGDSQVDLACQVALELVKARIFLTNPDYASARGLLSGLLELTRRGDVRPDVCFDVLRFLYHVSTLPNVGFETSFFSVDATRLREEGARLGGISSALAELSIARKGVDVDPEYGEVALSSAYDILLQHGFVSGAFEIAQSRGSAALEQQHHAKADRCFLEALNAAHEGSFLHGVCTALVGRFQCSMFSGQTQQAREQLVELSKLARSELGIGAVGLNVVAAHQLLGDHKAGAELARRCERLFKARNLHRLESRASFAEGACLAGTNDWKGARRSWERSCRIDERRRERALACDKMTAVAQAVAMDAFLSNGEVSGDALERVEKMLLAAEERLSACASGEEFVRIRGRLLKTRAQLYVIARKPVAALKALGQARTIYTPFGAECEIAFVDALSGLALLEAAKVNGAEMFDEATTALQRALDYFSEPRYLHVCWKIKYYLSIAAYLSAQSRSSNGERARLQHVAAEWLREARVDVERIKAGEAECLGDGSENEFSPGLEPAVMEPLEKALGLVPKKRKRKGEQSRDVEASGRRISRTLH